MLNLAHILEDSARRFPTKTAFISGTNRLSYAELNQRAARVAAALINSGLQPGDKVALSSPNVLYFPVIYYGILKAGGVVVPLSILLKREEITYHLIDSEARYYFCFEGTEALPMGKEGSEGFAKAPSCQECFILPLNPDLPAVLNPGATFAEFLDRASYELESGFPTGAEDTAVIIYTSGTTGKPKGAELTHSNLMWNADLCRHLFEFKPDDRLLIVLPLFHIFGQTCLMNAGIMHGLSSVLLIRFDAVDVQQWLLKEQITIFAGVPTMYWGLTHGGNKNEEIINGIRQNLRRCISGGAALPVQLLRDFEQLYGVEIYEGYGMSEGSPVVTFNHPGKPRKAGSIGIPVWGVEVKLVDEQGEKVPINEKGELLYRGHNVMKGYYKKPAETAAALKEGWLHSGDVAIQDEDGYFFIVDRTKDMIIRGGLNVYPREVEEVMVQHPAVSMVAVIGIPDEIYGEEIKAFVVLKPDQVTDGESLIQWTKSRLASYKYPRHIEFLTALPMNATGKILKRELRKTN